MFFDFTGWAILLSFSLAITCFAFSHITNRDFSTKNAVEVFLSTLFGSIAGQIVLIASKGNPDNLPSSWRIYLAIGGGVIVFNAVRRLVKAFGKLKIRKH